MAVLRIKVGASVDSSVDAVFPRIERASARARTRIAKDFGTDIPSAMKKGTDKAEAAYQRLVNEVEGKGAKMLDPATRGTIAFGKAAKSAFDETAMQFKMLASTAERELKKIEKAEAAAASGAGGGGGGGGGGRFGRRVGYWSMRNFSPVTPMLSVAGRVAGDIARGAGVRYDTGTLMQSFVERQKMAVDIANSGYQPGAKGAAGVLQSSAAINAEAMGVGKATSTDPLMALQGLQKFVAITGDLETGRAILADMAKLTNATGSSMEDVVDAAGEISAKLGDIPDKANTINAVMRQIAGAGKLGAVEMRDFASQLGKIAGLASRFQGDRAANIGEMGVLMQLARQKGGSGSAAQAATAVTGFVSALRTPANIKHFEALTGHSAYVDAAKTTLASPEAIILMALRASNGSQPALGKIFNKRAMDVMGGAANIYHEAGGGAVGEKAVGDYFTGLRKAAMTAQQVEEANARAMATTKAKVQAFNNALQEIADQTAVRLLPALEQLAPKALKVAEALGSVIEWFASHSLGADVAALITASFAKAALENTLRAGVERMLGVRGGGGGVGGGGGGGNFIAGVGAVAGVGLASWTVGTMMVDKMIADIENTQKSQTKNAIDGVNTFGEKDPEKLAAAIEKQKKNVEGANALIGDTSWTESLISTLAKMTGRYDEASQAASDRQRGQQDNARLQLEVLQEMERHLAALKARGTSVSADTSGTTRSQKVIDY